ncbi:hypothetical protein C8A05DRAFT_39163 [Staphylotrichum tortipilum]|uniref:Uncharacterized protein n=1 Tax=Staphylotrichum tortipilum TaxID=2831512 RepID=A0AAN6MA98_9PEZI|nr:hypothetical protein C8A05DRAFT_39163 [Staphylotrichum longicolle]
MAAPLDDNDIPEFNNTEEDWPDPDVDSSTEEGAEITRRNETSIMASITRDVQQQVQTESADDDDDDDIPQSVYDKARDHNDQLTETERQLLLSRGDLVGLALAYPDSLTTDEIHDIFGWPPPDVTRANIQRAVGNTLISTPSEMYARVSNALDLGQFDTAIGDDEIILIMRLFHASENGDYNMKTPEDLGVPAFMAARTLLSRRLQLDLMTRRVVAYRYRDLNVRRHEWPAGVSVAPPTFPPGSQGDRGQATRDILTAINALQEQQALGNISEADFLARSGSLSASLTGLWPGPPRIPPEIMIMQSLPAWVRERYIAVRTESWPRTPSQPVLRADRSGAGPWPDYVPVEAAIDLFSEGTGSRGLDRDPDWADLPEAEKETYRARSEARRREAWAWFGRRLEREALERSPACPQPPPRAEPFEVFRDEQVAENRGEEVDFWEVVRRWDALSDEERWSYDEKMQMVNIRAMEEWQERMSNAAATADAAAPVG